MRLIINVRFPNKIGFNRLFEEMTWQARLTLSESKMRKGHVEGEDCRKVSIPEPPLFATVIILFSQADQIFICFCWQVKGGLYLNGNCPFGSKKKKKKGGSNKPEITTF